LTLLPINRFKISSPTSNSECCFFYLRVEEIKGAAFICSPFFLAMKNQDKSWVNWLGLILMVTY